MTLSRTGVLRIGSEPPVGVQRPSATLMFRSMAAVLGAKGMGVLLTGMGEDGALGLLELRQAGGAYAGGRREQLCRLRNACRRSPAGSGVCIGAARGHCQEIDRSGR